MVPIREGNLFVWRKGDFCITWDFHKQTYTIKKGVNTIRTVHRWIDAKPYLE